MSPREIFALRDYLAPDLKGRSLSDARREASLTDIASRTCLKGRLAELSGRSVLLAASDQFHSALAMLEIDGIARRMLLCPPDLNAEHFEALLADAEIDAIVTDQPARFAASAIALVVTAGEYLEPTIPPQTERATEWLMLTSGTLGLPKIVGHTLEGLTGAIVAGGPERGAQPVWATFYDIRRYGGLQIFLRAIVGGGSMVLSEPTEAVADHVARLKNKAVSHISGTPSHWRKLLMSGAACAFSPKYIRLSGEIADQAVLDGLRHAFPSASIGHAYASTEAGVGFAVNDGFEGFPANMIGESRDGVEMKIVDGCLRIRSRRAAHAYVGRHAPALTDAEGFVDTGDMVERRGERYHFVGRRGGIINIGGLKVHPEEIEAVINRHDEVRMARVRARRSPITGAIVVADVVLADGCDIGRGEEIRNKIIADCRASLAPHKVPAMIKFVDKLDITAAGKLARSDA
ncbi:MAG TPA: class I adenylate-forming enzyme family protein [Bradyrhizobium sp.]|nr:class I adenylate-forming enzyme family protein [Bradyrhizobium sp.]